MALKEIPIEQLEERETNLRRDSSGEDLVASVKVFGVLSPLNVTRAGKDHYWVNAGARRLDAARRVGLATVPCLVEAITDDQVPLAMLIENLKRDELSAVEEAHGYATLIEAGMKRADIASQVGVPSNRVARRLLLLTLPERWQDEVHAGQLDIGLAEHYVKLQDPELVARACSERWSEWRVVEEVAIKKVRVLEAKLAKATHDAGLDLVPDSKICRDLATGSKTQWWAWSRHGDAVEVVDPGSIELAAAAERKNVVGAGIKRVRINDEWTLGIVPVVKEKAPQHLIDRVKNAEAQAKAKAEIREREEAALRARAAERATELDGDDDEVLEDLVEEERRLEAERAEIARAAADAQREVNQAHFEAFQEQALSTKLTKAGVEKLTLRWMLISCSRWAARDVLGKLDPPQDEGGADPLERLVEVYEAGPAAVQHRILMAIVFNDLWETDLMDQETELPVPVFGPILELAGWVPPDPVSIATNDGEVTAADLDAGDPADDVDVEDDPAA